MSSSSSRWASWSRMVFLGLAMIFVTQSTSAFVLEASNDASLLPLFQEMAQLGEIHIDQGMPPSIEQLELVKRQATTGSTSSTITALSTRSPTRSGSASVTATTTVAPDSVTSTVSSASSTSTSDIPTTMPTPFDTSLGNNFTQTSCPTFFNSFINNATFKSCLPVSLLLQNSIGFFKATKSAKYLDSVLDAACDASLAICSPLMASIAAGLLNDNNCGQDYKRQNPIVMQAYTGLVSYEPLYKATCLMNSDTSNYCYVDAVVNVTNTADVYPYYTALGLSLPSIAQPTCNTCLQQTMTIFAGYARQKDQPLSRTYLSSASQINVKCGQDFAKTNVQVAVDASKTNTGHRRGTTEAAFTIAASWILWFALT